MAVVVIVVVVAMMVVVVVVVVELCLFRRGTTFQNNLDVTKRAVPYPRQITLRITLTFCISSTELRIWQMP